VENVDGAIVYKARNSIEARALAAYLDNADISAHVAGEVMENIWGRISATLLDQKCG
jgi:hypothetical protein